MAKKYKNLNWILLGLFGVFLLFNQFQLSGLSDTTGSIWEVGSLSQSISLFSGNDDYDLSDVDVTEIESTAQGIALLFPVDEIETTEDAIAMMVPTGTPEYGEAMGVSFDDAQGSLDLMENAYYVTLANYKQDEELWARYVNLASNPRGISCEYCCGINAHAVTTEGVSMCGCAHNPALQLVTLWLMDNTDYSDAEILREVYRWKSLWFPQKMVGLAIEISGGNTDVLALPGMVGGC
ncbi:MAG: hypothetical protein Q8Q35_01900 [Nanoarchaeota archaeon]|nr:hypothetical protein [Nanoarchaeota archaeon]